MTENEAKWEYCRAIDLIKRIKTEETHERYVDRHKSFDMAIQALEEIQQYRAIGTVEGCEKAMDFELAKQDKSLAEVIDEYLEYIKIGTIEEFKALKVKKPKKKSDKVIFSHDSYAYCPHCKGSIEAEFMKPRNCRKCGGELDWQ